MNVEVYNHTAEKEGMFNDEREINFNELKICIMELYFFYPYYISFNEMRLL
jgi:hypothetical protein